MTIQVKTGKIIEKSSCCVISMLGNMTASLIKSDKQKAIIEASYKLFTDKGYFNTTVDDIAHAAKVGKGTIYNYFADKETILTFLMSNNLSNAINLLKEIDVKDPATALEKYILTGYEHTIDMAPIMMQCIDINMIIHNQGNKDKIHNIFGEAKKVLEKILEEGIRQGLFDGQIGKDLPLPYAAENLGLVIRQYMIGLFINSNDITKLKQDLPKHAKRITNLILYGITSKKQEGETINNAI